MKINKYLIKNFDWYLFGIAMVLSIIGIMTIFSATRQPSGGGHPIFYIKQMYWLCLGILALIIIVSFDYIWFARVSYIFYAVGILLLLAVHIIGKTGMGAQRWINLGPLSFQPSEIFKLSFIIAFARYMSSADTPLTGTKIIKAFFIFVAVPFFMLIKQPDLGTALILLLLFISITLAMGVKRKVILFLLIVGLISMPFLGNIFWNELRDYQRDRLVAFVEPSVDPSGIGYQIIQSKVAIGSGGFSGKGYLQGTQGPFRFLPERHTDFIFSVFAEEWGFMGSMLLLLVYLGLIYQGIDTAKRAKDSFGRLLALGLTFMIAIYTVVNIGMTMGLMPIVGIPLPFMSYGGTALLSNFIAIALLINIRARRFQLFY